MIRRKLTIVLLALTSVGGFAWGIASAHRMAHFRRDAIESHVREICADAARSAVREALPAPTP